MLPEHSDTSLNWLHNTNSRAHIFISKYVNENIYLKHKSPGMISKLFGVDLHFK